MDTKNTMEKVEFVEGRVDWKGRRAVKNKHGGIRTSILVLAAFAFENMATLALSVNLITYFTGIMHFELPDAANHLTNYSGTGYILSIAAAFLADTYIGRFKVGLVSACIEFLGIALLTLQAHYPKLKPPPCSIFDQTVHCEQVDGGNAVLLFIALYMIAAGAAGLKATLPSHGADQFDEKDPQEAKQMSSFFNSLLLAICVGGAASLTLIVWIQDNKGWDWGFGISTIAMLMAVVIFAAGLPLYRIYVVQQTSAILEIIQVYVAAIRNRKLDLPENPADLYEINRDKEAAIEAEFLPHRDTLRFLDKAAIQISPAESEKPEARNPWKLCRVTQVENAKTILAMIPIFLSAIMMTLCLAQLFTFSIIQASTMDRSITKSFHIPPASLPIIPTTFMIILVPVYDRIFVPFARRITGHRTGITHLQRIGVGLTLGSLSMAIAAIMEVKRKNVARSHNMLDAIPTTHPLPMSVFWLSFQFFIFGIADIFTYVGLLHFFYMEAPKSLKSISTCFLWCSMAIGYFSSTILVKTVNRVTKGIGNSGGWLEGNNINRNHLNRFYWLLSIMNLINFCVYLFCAKKYQYKPQSPIEVPEENKTEKKITKS
ncbi:hypothetical protein L1049_010557 [Liquidambar formosana]|uniref:Uncharacterized protein n=1 Tax=Liquidambar formosana TaxID=63359 RepID=A0AAP0N9J5_LIQFO